MPVNPVDSLTPQPADSPATLPAAADTVAQATIPVAPWDRVMTADQAPAASADEWSTSTGILPFMRGMEPEPRALLPGYDSGVMALLIGVFLMLAVNFRHYSTFIKTFAQDLWNVRRRGNVFEDHTLSETRVLLSFILLTCVCEGVLTFSALTVGQGITMAVFPVISLLIGIALVYYGWQVAAYRMVGYVFADKLTTRQWIKGFNASQALLGLLLTVPALIVLFNPSVAMLLFYIGLMLYIVARIIFISKGFRLFYDKIGSLLYFILYLCTLEIVPLIVLYNLALLLVNSD